MSILQTAAPHQHTSAILQSLIHEKLDAVEWPGYVHARDQIVERQNVMEQVLNRKRIEALKYLGNKARGNGEKYNKAESRVFTPEFVLELGKANSVRRIQCNPWLENMVHGIGEDGLAIASTNGNVLLFGPSIGVQNTSTNMLG